MAQAVFTAPGPQTATPTTTGSSESPTKGTADRETQLELLAGRQKRQPATPTVGAELVASPLGGDARTRITRPRRSAITAPVVRPRQRPRPVIGMGAVPARTGHPLAPVTVRKLLAVAANGVAGPRQRQPLAGLPAGQVATKPARSTASTVVIAPNSSD